MPLSNFYRTTAASLTLLAAGALTTSPFVTRQADAARLPALKFYDGSGLETSGEGAERSVWLATTDGKSYGTVGGLSGLETASEGGRVNGTFKRQKVKATLVTPKNKTNGTFTGTVTGSAADGAYQFGGRPTTTWSADAVLPSAEAIAEIGGSYKAEGIPSPGTVTAKFNAKKKTFSIVGKAKIGAGTITVAEISGRWIADTNGNLWMLGTKFKYNELPGVPDLPFPLPKKGAIVKAAYTLDGGTLTLADTANPEEPLATLTRQ